NLRSVRREGRPLRTRVPSTELTPALKPSGGPCLTSGPLFVTHKNVRFRLHTPSQRLGGLKAISYQSVTRERKSVVPVDTEAVSTAGLLLFKCGLSMMGFRTAR